MTWNIHQRNLTPHYYNAPEQQLNEELRSYTPMDRIKDTVADVATLASRVPKKVGRAVKSRARQVQRKVKNAARSLQLNTSV